MKFQKGYYKVEKNWFHLLQVQDDGTAIFEDGNGIIFNFEFKYGDFGEAMDEIKEKTGINNYNVEMKMLWNENLGDGFKDFVMAYSELGIISENGEKCVSKSGGGMGVVELQKISEEEANIIMNDCDPIEAPPGPYKIQPEVPGKVLWLSGSPGMGKSTSAQILAREDGYVYYEADCFPILKNPYIPLDAEEPTMAQRTQKNLKGPGQKERNEISQAGQKEFSNFICQKDYNKEAIKAFYEAMATDVRNEKERIGGTFAIAHLVLTRENRDFVRNILGSDVVFVLLNMSKENMRKRLHVRHHGEETAIRLMETMASLFEPAQEDEVNTFDVVVNADMTREEVVAEIKKKIKSVENM